MGCTITNPANGKESVLFEKFKEIFGNEREAEIQYAKLLGNSFKDRFGDWVFLQKNPRAKNFTILAHIDSISKEEAKEQLEINTVESLEKIQEFKRLGQINATTNEPKLFQDLNLGRWFFYDKNGDKDYIDKMKLSEFSAQEIQEVTNHLLYRFVFENDKKSFNEYTPDELENLRIADSIDNSIAAYKESIIGEENEEVLLE